MFFVALNSNINSKNLETTTIATIFDRALVNINIAIPPSKTLAIVCIFQINTAISRFLKLIFEFSALKNIK